MAITEDTTNSPAMVVGSGATVQTVASTPVNTGCIAVALMWGDANTGAADETLTASDTLGGTWTPIVSDNARGGAVVAAAWRAIPAGTAASMQAIVTDNKGSVARGIFMRYFTGTDLTSPIGVTVAAGTAAVSLISTAANSWCWSVHLGSNATQTAGANTTQKAQFGGFDSGDAIGAYASTNTTAPSGTTITITESGGTTVHHIAFELLPPGGGPATLNGAVTFAAGAQLAAAGVATENAAVTLSAGAQLAAGSVVTKNAAVVFGAGAQLAAAGTVTELGSVGLAAGATFGVSAGAILSGAVAFSSVAVLTPTATRVVLPSAGFAAGAALAIAGVRTATVAVALSSSPAVGATATAVRLGAIDFSAGAALGATPASNVPLVRAILIPGGYVAATLIPGGTAPATLIPSGVTATTLIADGV